MFIKVSVHIDKVREYFKVHNFDGSKTLKEVLDTVWQRSDAQQDDDDWTAYLSADGQLDDAPEIDLVHPLEAAQEIGCKHVIFAFATATLPPLPGAGSPETQAEKPADAPAAATSCGIAVCDAQATLPCLQGTPLLATLRKLRAQLAVRLGIAPTATAPSSSAFTLHATVFAPAGTSGAVSEAVARLTADALSSPDPLLVLRILPTPPPSIAEATAAALEAAPLPPVSAALLGSAASAAGATHALQQHTPSIRIFSAAAEASATAPVGAEQLLWGDILSTALPDVSAAKQSGDHAGESLGEWILPDEEGDLPEAVGGAKPPVQFGDAGVSELMWRTQTADVGAFMEQKTDHVRRSHTDSAVEPSGLPAKAEPSEGQDEVRGGWVFEEEHSSSADYSSAVDKADWMPLERTRTEAPAEDAMPASALSLPRSHTSPVNDVAKRNASKGVGFLMSLPKKGSLGTQHSCYGKVIAHLREPDGDGEALANDAGVLACDAADRLAQPTQGDASNPLSARMSLRTCAAYAYSHYLSEHARPAVCLAARKGGRDAAPLLEAFSEEHEQMLEVIRQLPSDQFISLPAPVSLEGIPHAAAKVASVGAALKRLRDAVLSVPGVLDENVALLVKLRDAREVVKELLEHHKGIGTLNLVAHGSVAACMLHPHLADALGSSLAELYKLRNLTSQVRRKRIMDVINTAFKAKCAPEAYPAHHAVVGLTKSMLLLGPEEQVPRLLVDTTNVLTCLLESPGPHVLSAVKLIEGIGERLDEDPASIVVLNAIYARLEEMAGAQQLPPHQLWDLRRIQLLRDNGWVSTEERNKQLDHTEGAQLRLILTQVLQTMLMGDTAMLTRALLVERYPCAVNEGRLDLQWTTYAQAKRMFRDLSQLAYELEPREEEPSVVPLLVRHLEQVARQMPPQVVSVMPPQMGGMPMGFDPMMMPMMQPMMPMMQNGLMPTPVIQPQQPKAQVQQQQQQPQQNGKQNGNSRKRTKRRGGGGGA